MSYPLRWIRPGHLYETTSRAIHSRLLLRPSAELNTIINGILAKAVEKCDVKVCNYIVHSNHMHMLLIPGSVDQLRRFMNFVNGNIAKEGGRLHGWREKFWGRRYRLIPITNEPEAQVSRLRYLLANGCKEGLVRKPADWPGASGLMCLLKGVPIVGHRFDRTAEYRAGRRGDTVGRWDFAQECSFELEPLPCWEHLPPAERQKLVLGLVQEIERETRERLEAEDRSPMGARRILRQNPHDRPKKTKRFPAPLVHAATWDEWIGFKKEWEDFRHRYRGAAERLGRGALDVVFPRGSIPPPLPVSWVRTSVS